MFLEGNLRVFWDRFDFDIHVDCTGGGTGPVPGIHCTGAVVDLYAYAIG